MKTIETTSKDTNRGSKHPVVSRDEWILARKKLLEKEKAHTWRQDALSADRRNLPWEKIGKSYEFEGPQGRETLSDLFDGRSQLIVYHFMFGPGWGEGCPGCSSSLIILTEPTCILHITMYH